jgi:hypothetical protein
LGELFPHRSVPAAEAENPYNAFYRGLAEYLRPPDNADRQKHAPDYKVGFRKAYVGIPQPR